MKPLAILILVSACSIGYAQTEAPKKEFVISISQENVQLSANESRDIEVRISKSRAYSKGRSVMGFSSSLPTGVQASFTPDKGDFESTTLTIKASDAVVPGTYQVIVNASVNGKTKAAILKLTLTDKAIASDVNE